MAGLARIDLGAGGEEARLHALLEDMVDYYTGVYPAQPLALAVWFGKTRGTSEHNLLLLFSGTSDRINQTRDSLYWKQGVPGPPFINIYASSVNFFASKLVSNKAELIPFFQQFEVLHFEKRLLDEPILTAFNVITEPPGLSKGWYVSAREYQETKAPITRNLISSHGIAKPDIGLVKTWESQDFGYCRGLLQAEFQQKWLPLSDAGLRSFLLFTDLQDGRPGFLLFEGGALYQLVKIEVKTAPEYASLVLEKARDDRYPEVYLRAMLPPEQSPA